MPTRSLTESYAISPQIAVKDVADLRAEGFRTILCFRPDGEAPDQSDMTAIEQATTEAGMAFAAIPVRTGTVPDADQIARTRQALDTLPGPVVGYCRSGTRAAHIWALAEAGKRPVAQIVAAAEKAGVDVRALRPRLEELAASSPSVSVPAGSGMPRRDVAHFQVLIIGGGAGGLSVAGSLLRRNRTLSIGVVEPSNEHFYQPGWTLVGGGVFRAAQTRRKEADVMPKDVVWVKQAAKLFRPDVHEVVLGDGSVVSYDALIVATGITLNWDAIPGLAETLGKNGVTSNYRFDLAPYTWQLVQQLKGGTAIFTQPPMPIKCAGAPQKAVYLSCDAWKRRGVLDGISVEFDTATPGLFGVKDFVPPLMEYIRRYHVDLQTGSKLLEVDGPNRKAIFERKVGDTVERVERSFDMLHVVPPQSAPQIIRESALAGADGFVEVNPATLQHVRFPDVFAIGDVIGTSSAKTAAAARVQAPVVATNVLAFLKHQAPVSEYEGYGACPLTVENGRIVLAEFQYGGKLAPTMPKWLLNGQKPTRLAWWLKKYVMPLMYWDGMLKGRELMVAPKPLTAKKGG